VLLKWAVENVKMTERIKELQGKWVVATGRMEIGIPPEVRLEEIKEALASPKKIVPKTSLR
jgi:hypothetical protein